MNKTRQQGLARWLRQQGIISRRWPVISRLLGVASGLLIVAQAWFLVQTLYRMVMENIPTTALLLSLTLLISVFVLYVWVVWLCERVGLQAGQYIHYEIRRQALDRLQQADLTWIQGKPAGSWVTLTLEQIDDMHDYYTRYLPQMTLAARVPLLIVITISPINWTAALILLGTAPLIPFFMALVGMGVADANWRNFQTPARLSGHSFDRLRGMEIPRIFHHGQAETDNIRDTSQDFCQRTMEVLRLAFLSSGVLELSTSLSIALVVVYFGSSYLGELNFGHYGAGVMLMADFPMLILAPESFQSLCDLGTFYHAKAQAVGAADSLETLMETPLAQPGRGGKTLDDNDLIGVEARDLVIKSLEGRVLARPLNFPLSAGVRVVLVSQSGSGKSSLLSTLLGFLPYEGSLKVSNVELRELDVDRRRRLLSWAGQNPQLPATTLRENVLLAWLEASDAQLRLTLDKAWVSEFIALLPDEIHTAVGDQAGRLLVGQAQRIAVARALLVPCCLLLLDELAASPDAHSEQRVMQALTYASTEQTTLLVAHQLKGLVNRDAVRIMQDGQIIEQGDYTTLVCAGGVSSTLLAHRQGEI